MVTTEEHIELQKKYLELINKSILLNEENTKLLNEKIKKLEKINQAGALINCLLGMYLKEEGEILDSNILLFSFKIRRINYLQAEVKRLFEIAHFLEDL